MPRAFLITHRRYNDPEEFPATGRDYSPERGVRLAEYSGGQPTSDGASDCGSETSSECPEELYNLTKLAEVSLAAAAGTLIHPSKEFAYEAQFPARWEHRVVDRYEERRGTAENETREGLDIVDRERASSRLEVEEGNETELSLRERTRLFFERIESERENFETRNAGKSTSESRSMRVGGFQDSSVSRSREDEEIFDISGSNGPSEYRDKEERNEPRSASVLASLSRKETLLSSSSSSSSSSEGSKSDDSEDHECPDCGKKYSTSSNLARHRQTHRSLGDKKARRCPHCDKIYVSMPAFSMHVRTHNQGCKCHYCGKCFSRPWLLQGHIRTHTGEKPFKCTICNKAFADKSNLRAHVQTHSNTKPHVCGRCGKAFALKSYLYKHEESSCMRAHHRAVSEKRETSAESIVNSTTAPPAAISSSLPSMDTTVTASPTSVIVQCPSGNRDTNVASPPTTFSRIIRHTRNHSISGDICPAVKRHCGEKLSPDNVEISNNSGQEKSREFLSRMVIRTSVISPNPEHLIRLNASSGSVNVKKSPPFDFTDPARTSAFSRPTTISLNLAIA